MFPSTFSAGKSSFIGNSLKFHLFVMICSFSFILVLTGLFSFVLRIPQLFLNTTKRLKIFEGNKLYTHVCCLCSCHWPSQVMMINTKKPCMLPYDKETNCHWLSKWHFTPAVSLPFCPHYKWLHFLFFKPGIFPNIVREAWATLRL